MSFDAIETTVINDLVWAINSPSLIGNVDQNWEPRKIAKDEIDATEFLRFFGSQNHRVGRYFERLISYYLTGICRFTMIAEQKQIIINGKTVGEIDFLFRDSCGQTLHLETAVKFYLHLPDATHQGSRLVGPNPNDFFERKVDRMLTRQLSISEEHFDQIHELRSKIDYRLLWMAGRIYDHYADRTIAESHSLSPDHLRGIWFHAREWTPSAFPTHSRIELLRKPHWLSGSVLQSPNQGFGNEQFGDFVRNHFAQTSRPLHGCVAGDVRQFFFIVSDRWPSLGQGSP